LVVETDENNTELKVVLSVADENIASEIIKKVNNEGLISWQELVNMYRDKGVSTYRLRKILLTLLSREEIVELPCRMFTTMEYLEKVPKEALKDEIIRKVSSAGVRKCGKPLGIPYDEILISISRNKKITVIFRRWVPT